MLRSVLLRGLGPTLAIRSYEKRYEQLFGIATGGIKKSENKLHFHYQGAGYKTLLDVFAILPAELREKRVIDYGSGKGRALFCAEYSGFNLLTGVELNKELNDAAKANLKTYQLRRKESTFDFVNDDAVNFPIPPDSSVFYFFNPFSEIIMKKVLKNILIHALQQKRVIFVIYLNPQYKSLWEQSGFSMYKTIKTGFYTEAIIYKFQPFNYQ